jgi:hypothetical protein
MLIPKAYLRENFLLNILLNKLTSKKSIFIDYIYCFKLNEYTNKDC